MSVRVKPERLKDYVQAAFAPEANPACTFFVILPDTLIVFPVYLAFEGNVDEFQRDIPYLKSILGPDNGMAPHQYAYSVGEMPILTRSTAYLKRIVNSAFDLAEKEDVPIMFHIDPMYGFFADTETDAKDAPAKKYWNEPEMREWLGFPNGTKLPDRIPRPWFNWGSWVSPAPALPAFGSAKFLKFAEAQLTDGMAKPIAERVRRLGRVHRSYLFAGVNIGWETHFLDNHGIDPSRLPVAVWPVERRGVRMLPWEVDGQSGYASLYWKGWNGQRLKSEAIKRKITETGLRDLLLFQVVHNYMQGLAMCCGRAGLPRNRIYTHIVAISSVHPEATSTSFQPTWVAVNPYSTPGFTMDNRGAAVYNLSVLKSQITIADSTQTHFGAIESYLNHSRDEASCAEDLRECFDQGGTIKVLFGPFGKGTPFELDPQPRGATLAILKWLKSG